MEPEGADVGVRGGPWRPPTTTLQHAYTRDRTKDAADDQEFFFCTLHCICILVFDESAIYMSRD